MQRSRSIRLPKLALTVTIICIAPPGAAAAERAGSDQGAVRSYLVGNGLLNRGMFDLAAREYRTFLNDHAEHDKAPVARYGLAVCLLRTGQHGAALIELKQLAALDGFEFGAEVATLIGQCHLAAGDVGAAVESLTTALARYPTHELADDAAGARVESLHRGERHDETIDACSDFASHWPDSPLRDRVDFFCAASLMAKQDYPGAAERYAALLRRDPDASLARPAALRLAQCHHNRGDLAEARQGYERVIEQDTSTTLPDAMVGLAMVLQSTGDAAGAGLWLDRFLGEFADHALTATARLQRGRAWFDEGRYDEALEVFTALGGPDTPQRAEARYWGAKCRMRQGAFGEAADALDQLNADFPDHALRPEFSYDRAVALFQSGEHASAAKELEEYRARFPGHAMVPDALHLHALAAHHLRDYDRSAGLCGEFLDRYGAHRLAESVAFLNAENAFLAGQYERSIERYDAFLKRYAGSNLTDKVNFRMGIAYHRLERDDRAAALLAPFADGHEVPEAFRVALLALGDIAFRRADWPRAELHLNAYLGGGLDGPSVDDALLKLALARQRQNKHAQAVDDFDRLLNRFSDSPHRVQAVFERGQSLLALGRFDDARQAFQLVIDQGESRFRPFALNHLGGIAIKTGDFEQAARQLESAIADTSDASLQAGATFRRGQALLAGHQFAEAEEMLRAFVAAHPDHADAPRARAQLAIALARQDMYPQALAAIAECEQDNRDHLDPALFAALQHEKGWCLRQLGRVEEAAVAYRQLIAAESTPDAHALLDLAALESDAGRYEQAGELLRRLRDQLPMSDLPDAAQLREQSTYGLAVCAFQTDRHEEAAALFAELLEEFPNTELAASAGYFCGEALFTLQRHERAVVYLARVVERYPSDAAYAAALLRMGECQALLQRWALSEQAFVNYLQRFSDADHAFQARFGVGWACENQQRYDEAMTAYRQVTEAHDGATAARAQFQIGECLFAKEQFEQAVAEFLKVDILYAYPEWSAAANYEAGRCLERLARTVEARRQFQIVTDSYAGTDWARLANQRLIALVANVIPGK